MLLAEESGCGDNILSTDAREFGAYRWKHRKPFRNLLWVRRRARPAARLAICFIRSSPRASSRRPARGVPHALYSSCDVSMWLMNVLVSIAKNAVTVLVESMTMLTTSPRFPLVWVV